MRLFRIAASSEEVSDGLVVLSGKKARHVARVLRLTPGTRLLVIHAGKELVAEIRTAHPARVTAEIIEVLASEHQHEQHVTLAFSCVRPGPMEQILRHGTELGVSSFVPLLTGRSNRRPATLKDRWENIIVSAVRQCGRLTIPRINDPAGIGEFLQERKQNESCLLLSMDKHSSCLISELEKGLSPRVVLLVGPEGGFLQQEIDEALAVGFKSVTLGRTILRSETAALLASGMVSLWCSRQSGPGSEKA